MYILLHFIQLYGSQGYVFSGFLFELSIIMNVRIQVYMYVYMHACMHACMHVRMYHRFCSCLTVDHGADAVVIVSWLVPFPLLVDSQDWLRCFTFLQSLSCSTATKLTQLEKEVESLSEQLEDSKKYSQVRSTSLSTRPFIYPHCFSPFILIRMWYVYAHLYHLCCTHV